MSAVLGAIIGDIAGSKYEFDNRFDKNFELLDKDCYFTDDTILTLAVAKACKHKLDYAETLRKICKTNDYTHNYKSSFGARYIKNRKINAKTRTKKISRLNQHFSLFTSIIKLYGNLSLPFVAIFKNLKILILKNYNINLGFKW